MKKNVIRTALFSVVLLAGMGQAFAFDAAARIVMKGSLVTSTNNPETKTTKYDFLQNNQTTQKDPDGIEIAMNGDVAGAHVALWYITESQKGEDDWAAYFRRSYIWVKPVKYVKLRLGYNGTDGFFKERIDQWKVGSPFAIAERKWDPIPTYINCSDVEGWGFGAEVYPIDGLILNAAIAPAKSNPSMSFTAGDNEKDFTYTPWGAGARYYWNNLSFQASYRDGGQKKWKVVRAGVGYDGDGIYGFFQPILGLNYNSKTEKLEATGLCLDMYGEYSYDAFKILVHAPVTVRFNATTSDPHYMELNVLGKYNFGTFGSIDDLSPYLNVKTISTDDDVTYRAWQLNQNFVNSFDIAIVPGVEMKIGRALLNVGAEFDIYSKFERENGNVKGAAWNWSVPFKVEIGF